ncbi:MAG TPA: hypothetical protein VIY90_20120 [Steroidobacteraceae bacterium]
MAGVPLAKDHQFAPSRQERMVEHERKLKAQGNAEHEEAWEVWRPDEFPEKCRQHAEQRERAEYEAGDRLKNYEQKQCWDADALPKKPESTPDKTAGGRCSLVHWAAETHAAHGWPPSIGGTLPPASKRSCW